MVNGTMVVQSVGSSMTCVDAVAGNPAAGKECSLASALDMWDGSMRLLMVSSMTSSSV